MNEFFRARHRRVGAWLCLVVFIVAQTNLVAAQTLVQTVAVPRSQAEPARRVPPRQFIPPRDYDMKHIKLDLRFDWAKEQAIGTATLRFSPLLKDTREVAFDARNMDIKSVKLSTGANLVFKHTDNRLRVTLDKPYQLTDDVTVAIDYNTRGVISDKGILGFGQGLTFIKPTAEDPKRPNQIWSQGESEYNSTWFPCHDHPNDFATSETIVTTEKKYTVISNGKLIEKKENADGTNTWHWRIAAPHVSYLISLIVGEYVPVEDSYDGIPVVTYTYPNMVEEGRITGGRTAKMVEYFSKITGVRYPFEKYAQTFVRDFGGGMENITATTLTDTTLFDKRAALEAQTEADSLIAHELAHQWFGDFVTTRTWAHIWLNESFATYFQALWRQHAEGEDQFLYSDVKGNQDQYLGAWKGGQRRPLVTDNYAEADDLFDAYAYPRGGATLHMLRKLLGDDAFFRSMTNYLKANAHKPVVTEQFRIAIEDTTGQPMDWFFDQWVYKMGHPVFNVTKSYDAAAKRLTLNVKQEQKPIETSGYPQTAFFRVPLEVEIISPANRRVERVTVLPQAEQTLTFDNVEAEPLSVDFDNGGDIVKELKFEKPVKELVYQATKDADLLDRLRALDDMTAKATNAQTPDAERQAIITAMTAMLSSDKFYGARVEAARSLTRIPSALKTEAVKQVLLAATKNEKSQVRAAAIEALATTKDSTLAGTYRAMLNDESYLVIRAAASALGATKNSASYEDFQKLVRTDSFRNRIRIAGLTGLAQLEDSRALDAALLYAAKNNDAPVRGAALSLLASIGKKDARAYPIVAEAFSSAVANGNFQLAVPAGQALAALGDARGLDAIKEVRPKIKNPQALQFLGFIEQRLQASINAAQKKPVAEGQAAKP